MSLTPYSVNQRIATTILTLLQARGPDFQDWKSSQNPNTGFSATLMHTRLSILDQSVNGHQPMSDDVRQIDLVFNGEIYNFGELRHQLKALGHSFRSQSDTEVLLKLYSQYGDDCVSYLDGMFAFAIVDRSTGKLFAARDRFGKKPFLYSVRKNQFLFASTVSALLAFPNGSKQINGQAVAALVGWGDIPTPNTLFADIFHLPPGHQLTWSEAGICCRPYWQVKKQKTQRISFEAATQVYEKYLMSAIQKRFMSDGPVSALLSGGIDSSLVTGMGASICSKLKTFNAIYPDFPDNNESSYAQVVAEKYGTDHQEVPITADQLCYLPDMIATLGYPTRTFNIFATDLLAQSAKQAGKVCLSGDGADELHGGYHWHQIPFLPISVGGVETPSFDSIFALASDKHHARYVPKILSNLLGTYMTKQIVSDVELPKLMSGNLQLFLERLKNHYYGSFSTRHKAFDLIQQLMLIDIETHLLNHILHPLDALGMRHSVEFRTPFLDDRLFDFGWSLPRDYLVGQGVGKRLLKSVAKTWVPGAILNRKKSGLYSPFPTWVKLYPRFRGLIFDCINAPDSLSRQILSSDRLQMYLDPNQPNHRFTPTLLWILFSLEIWYQQFFTGHAVTIGPELFRKKNPVY